MIHVKPYNTLTSTQKNDFFLYLQSLSSARDPAHSNMWHPQWKTATHTLPHILECTPRFSDSGGQFYIMYSGDIIAGCGGVYLGDFDRRVAIAGVRTYVDTQFRNKSIVREYLLPLHKQWAIDAGAGVVALTFNSYNRNLIHVFKRRRAGERIDRINTRESKHMFYRNLHVLEYPVTVQYTTQWVMYEQLDDNFEFDWSTIRAR